MWVDFWEQLDARAWADRLKAGVKDPVILTPQQVAEERAALEQYAQGAGLLKAHNGS